MLLPDHGKKSAEGTPRDLISQHLEPDVVEEYGQDALTLVNSPLVELAQRTETSGETVFFYTSDATPLLHALHSYPRLRTLHRPAHLADLLFKLTRR